MTFYKFIKIKGNDSDKIGYHVPHLYKLVWSCGIVKIFGFSYIKDRLRGWTIWWVSNERDFEYAVEILNELKKIYKFDYMVSS